MGVIDQNFGHYEILGRLGAGGMGVVFKARDLLLDRLVALKLLHAGTATDPERRQRFAREARAVAALSHPNIVTIYAVEEHEGTPVLAMEYIEGHALDALITPHGLPLARLFEIAIPIARALTAAHERQIVHRDLKPGNVMIGARGEVKVLDFGLARVERGSGAASGRADDLPTATLTQRGVLLGTVPYMSPEQVQGKTAGHLSDIFSLGVVLYEMATGRRPFTGESTVDLGFSIVHSVPPSVGSLRPELPQDLGRIVRRCLEKEPERRYQTALDVVNELEDLRRVVDSGALATARAMLPHRGAESKHKVHMSPLIGREAETAELERLLERARSGWGSLVVIGGESGVGKTRLVEELIPVARERGFLTLVGHCYDTEGARPFSPWVEILEYTVRVAHRDVLGQLLGESAPDVAKLLPELRRVFPDIPPPIALPPEHEQHYLFTSFRQYVERSSQVQPLLLALEDLQWADDSTLLLLQHLARHLGSMAVLAVGTYRDVELDPGRPLEGALRQLVRERLAHRMTLKRLSEPGVAELLTALAGQEPPASLLRALQQTTEGNPFFVEEVFQHLKEEGALFDGEGRWRRDLAVEDLDVPEGVRLVVGRRLERLSEEARQTLVTAAFIGRRFHYDLLEALGDFEPESLVATLEEAERLRLIQPVSGREIRFEFSQELVRQTLASSLSTLRRQRLHLRLADAMERAFAGDLDRHASALAHHLYQAGAAADRDKTVRYLAQAGRQAVAAAASAEALRRFEEALSLLAADDDATRADLTARRAWVLRSLGRSEEAIAEWLDALPLFERLGDRAGVLRTCLGAAGLTLWLGFYRRGAELAERGLGWLGEEPSLARCRLLTGAATGHALAGDLAAAEPMMEEAFAQAATLHAGPRVMGEMLQSKAWIDYARLRYRDSIAGGSRGAELLRGLDEYVAASNLVVTLNALGRMGRGAEAQALAERLEQVAARLGHDGAVLYTAKHRFERTLMVRADFAAASEGVEAALGGQRAPWIGELALTMTGLASLYAGRTREAVDALAEAAALHARNAVGTVDGDADGYLFVCRSWAGEREAASEMLPRLSSGLPRPGERLFAFSTWRLLGVVEGLALLGDRERAAALHELVLEVLATGLVVRNYGHGLARTIAGISAGCAERRQEAEDHFAAALRQADELPHVIEQGEVRRWWAWTLLARGGAGDRDRARELLGEAIEIYERLNMPSHLDRARSDRAPADRAPG